MNKEIQLKTIKGFTFREMSVNEIKNHPSNTKFFTQLTEQKVGNMYGNFKSSTEELGESIQKNGIHTPLIVTKNNLILSGNRRYLWAIKLGINKVPCNIIQNDLTLEQEELLIIEYNLLNRKLGGDAVARLRKYRFEIYSRMDGIIDRVLLPKNNPLKMTTNEFAELTGVKPSTAKSDLKEMRKKATKQLNDMRFGENGVNVSALTSFKQRLGILVSEYQKSNKKTQIEMMKEVKRFYANFKK